MEKNMSAKIFETMSVYIGNIEADFFLSRLDQLKENIQKNIEDKIIEEGHKRVEEHKQENKKKWFFKKTENLEEVLNICNSEYDLRSCLQYVHNKKLKEYELLIYKINQNQDIGKARVREALFLLKEFDVITQETIEVELKKISNKILETA